MAVGFPTKANWAAGDVLTASAQDDLAGTVNLLSNASAASGSQLVSNVAGTSFAYQATPSSSNPVLNAGMNVWQRGTSISAAASTTPYTADRWQIYTNANQATTISRQATSDTTNLPNIQYCARVQRNSGQTGTGTYNFGQSFESINSIPFAGKLVSFSFYARAGANYSATSNALSSYVFTGTGTDQNRVTGGYTGDATSVTTTATLTTTWQRFTVTGTIPATATEMGVCFLFNPTGTAGTNDYFEVTGVQIDIGSVALPFRTYAGTLQGELAACQRYYQKSYDITVNPGTSAANGYSYSNLLSVANNSPYLSNPIKSMRVAPTVTIYGYSGTAGTVSEASNGVDKAANTGQAGAIGTEGFVVKNGNATTQTFSQGAIYQYTASAEL